MNKADRVTGTSKPFEVISAHGQPDEAGFYNRQLGTVFEESEDSGPIVRGTRGTVALIGGVVVVVAVGIAVGNHALEDANQPASVTTQQPSQPRPTPVSSITPSSIPKLH